MAHGDAWEGKWRGNWRMEWVASTLHTTSEHGLSSVTTADVHTSAASSRLNWCPRRFEWTRPFRRKTKSGFCACAITFEAQSTNTSEPRAPRSHLLPAAGQRRSRLLAALITLLFGHFHFNLRIWAFPFELTKLQAARPSAALIKPPGFDAEWNAIWAQTWRVHNKPNSPILLLQYENTFPSMSVYWKYYSSGGTLMLNIRAWLTNI